MPKKMNIKQEIKNFNERLRQAELKYGKDHRIVKMMKDKADQFMPEWTIKDGEKNRISTKTVVNVGYDKTRFKKYIKENTATKIIKEKLSKEKLEEMKKLKGQERIDFVKKQVDTVVANKELCNQIWQAMYDAGYDSDDCDMVYDELMSGDYEEELAKFAAGEISAVELGEKILRKIDSDRFGDYEEFQEDDFNDF